MKEVRFFKCEHCGKIVGAIKDNNVPLICCGEPMGVLVANTTDAAQEKHVPVVAIDGQIIEVKVGEVIHPMIEEHYIEWIYLLTEQGGQRKVLNPGDDPVVTFAITADDKPIAAYAYCNLHGLWKADI